MRIKLVVTYCIRQLDIILYYFSVIHGLLLLIIICCLSIYCNTFDEPFSDANFRTLQRIIPIEPCGVGYWIISSVQVPLAVVFTAWMVFRKESLQDPTLIPEVQCQNRNSPSKKLVFPLMALLAGILGGVFGIGGGMLISPLLLQVGIAPEVNSNVTCLRLCLIKSSRHWIT